MSGVVMIVIKMEYGITWMLVQVYLGKVENYGCPMKENGLDSDNDGVPDRDDLCIYIPGLKEMLGCPDSDEDGISDNLDDCPYVKGPSTNKGCPTNEADLKEHSGLLEFDTDNATIQSRYFPVLDKIAFQLNNNQRLRLIVEGHTDDEGNHLYNHQLSKKRAVNVQKYLLRKGVPAEQMELHFYGETKPIIGLSEYRRSPTKETEEWFLS